MAAAKRKKPPMQPIVKDAEGVVRFQANGAIESLIRFKTILPNSVALWHSNGEFSDDDYEQMQQLMGVSLQLYHDLPDVRPKSKAEARNKAISLGLLPPG